VELGLRLKPNLEPTLSKAELSLEPKELSAILKKAGKLDLPDWGMTRPYLTDQPTEFGLEGYREGRPHVRIEWNSPPLEALSSIAAWADQVRDWLRNAIP
jgi:hypothetical protein